MRLINFFTLVVGASLFIVTDLAAVPGVPNISTEQEHVGALGINVMEKIRESSSSEMISEWTAKLAKRARQKNHLVKPEEVAPDDEAAYALKLENLKAKLKNVTPVDDEELNKLKEELKDVSEHRKALTKLWPKEDFLEQPDSAPPDPFIHAYLILTSNRFRVIYEHFHPHDETLANKAQTDRVLFEIVGGFDRPREVAEILFLAGEHVESDRVKMYARALQDFQFQCWKVQNKSPESVAEEFFGVHDASPQQLKKNPLLKGILDSYSKYHTEGVTPELPK